MSSPNQSPQANRNRRRSDFLGQGLRRLYLALALACALGLITLPFLPIERQSRLLLWLILLAFSFGGACVHLLYWRGWGDQRESLLRRTYRATEERLIARGGLHIRERLTGLYTPEYWLHALEYRFAKLASRTTPVTCVMVGLGGLAEIRRQLGDARADDLLAKVGLELGRNVRPDDLVCRYRGGRFALALIGCPAKHQAALGERVARSVRGLAHSELPAALRGALQISYETATLPGDALTPMQLLQVTGKSLDLKLSFANHAAARGG